MVSDVLKELEDLKEKVDASLLKLEKDNKHQEDNFTIYDSTILNSAVSITISINTNEIEDESKFIKEIENTLSNANLETVHESCEYQYGFKEIKKRLNYKGEK